MPFLGGEVYLMITTRPGDMQGVDWWHEEDEKVCSCGRYFGRRPVKNEWCTEQVGGGGSLAMTIECGVFFLGIVVFRSSDSARQCHRCTGPVSSGAGRAGAPVAAFPHSPTGSAVKWPKPSNLGTPWSADRPEEDRLLRGDALVIGTIVPLGF